MTGKSDFKLRGDSGCDAGSTDGDHGLEMVSERSQVVKLFAAQFHDGLDKSINVRVTG